MTVAAVVLAVATANAMVDPFGIWGLVELPGWNIVKPAKHTRVRLLKAAELSRIAPRAIVLGTSRSHIALRTTHPGWDQDATPRYNAAFDGATPEEMFAYLRHAHAVRPLRQVVLGLDTWQLQPASPSFTRPGFDAVPLRRSESWDSAVYAWLAQTRLLLSLDTLAVSFATVRTQGEVGPNWLAPDGQSNGEVFFRRAGEPFVVEGPGALFRDSIRQEIGFMLPTPTPGNGAAREPGKKGATETSLDYIRRIIAFCRAENIDLSIFLSPIHALQLELVAELGGWEAIEMGKRELVRTLAEDARRHKVPFPFPLWDFTGYSQVTTEPVPPAGSHREMRFYWESSHFKQIVGDAVLARLFNSTNADVPEDFGVLLTEANVENSLALIRAGHDRYVRDHAAEMVELRALILAVRRLSISRHGKEGAR